MNAANEVATLPLRSVIDTSLVFNFALVPANKGNAFANRTAIQEPAL